MKKNPICLFLLIASLAFADQLQFEGTIPPDVNTAFLTAEYHRIYRMVAPRQRPDPRPLRIVYYTEKSDENFDNILPEWGGGGAIGGNLIVVPTAFKPFLEQSFGQVTRHELVHAVLARAYPGVEIPRWFHEGVAMTLAGDLSFQENVIVSKAIFTGSLMPLASIDSVNIFGRNRADLAYCQSHLSVLFLIEQYGMDVIPEILISARKTGSFWNGVHAALSLTPQEIEGLARKDISSRYQLVFVFADYYAFWVAIALLFLVAAGVAIVRKQKKLAQMGRDEKDEDGAMQSAATEEPPQAAPAVSPPPPTALIDSGDQPEEQIDMGVEKFPEEDEGEDDEEDYDEDDDEYILADGVELEDEEEEEEDDDDDDELEDEDEDEGEGKKN